MARRTTRTTPAGEPPEEKIVEIDVEQEMEGSFLEYAYSVIYARALPDARDGLKPVQRRILYMMADMGLRPDRGHVKSARVVGEVMGKLHPHGDAAIYDALVRLAQPFTLRLPLVDGHGNFGSLDDGPAAARYTEARLAPPALLLTDGLDEDVVDFVPNYDNQLTQPEVLASAFPNLLVNGASGIAVGMATNMPPHNLGEVVAAARHLIDHPEADLETLMRFVPGPDLPGGGKIVGLSGIADAYRGGRGTFRTRATATIENVTPRRKGIVITELPYLVGPEKVQAKLAEAVKSRKLQGVANFQDLTDRENGLRLVVEVKNGFNPEAVLEQLYRLTPMEESFGINNVALVDGQPRTLGLKELLEVYLRHRFAVVRRRCEFRLAKRRERLHLVQGLLTAIADIDRVIAIIRASDDAATARTELQAVLALSEAQAEYILELRLRRLTRFSRIELETEAEALAEQIAELERILGSEAALRKLVSSELAQVAKRFATPRRTVLLEADGSAGPAAATPLEIQDTACRVLLSTTGLIARTADDAPPARSGPRARHDALAADVVTSARADVAVITSAGRALRLSVLELPTLPATADPPSLAGGLPVGELVTLAPGEAAVCVASLAADAPPLALGTATGVVKRVTPEPVGSKDEWSVISLKDGDRVLGGAGAPDDAEVVMVTSGAQLLRFSAALVRPQGRAAGGMAGIKLPEGARVVSFGVIAPEDVPYAEVVTVAGSATALPGTETGTAKVTPFDLYPAKGRATGGVRAQRFLKGEDCLLAAWVGPGPARACRPDGRPVRLPAIDSRRDGSGVAPSAPIGSIG